MSAVRDKLSEAQESRRAREDASLERNIDADLDRIGLSEEAIKLGTADVGPGARKKLSGIIKRLAGKPHPFTQCMADLRKHHPEWSDDRRKKTCNVLKTLAGRNKPKKAAMSESACALIDDDVAALIELADLSNLEEEAA